MLREERYRRIRDRAVTEVARSIVRDPPREAAEGAGRRTADGSSDAGRQTADGSEDAGEPPGEGSGAVALVPAVRAWLDERFDEVFGDDLEGIEAAADVDPGTLDAPGVDALEESGDEDERKRLYAYRAVRADLLAALEPHAADLATAVEVHDALERLVGERGPPTDRRPRDVVAAFAEWAGTEGDVDTDPEALTVLHVMRIATLDPLGGTGPEGLLEAVHEWVSENHPGVLAGSRVPAEG